MLLDPQEARALLPRVDPGRKRSGRAVGLRDGAILALIASGLTTLEIADLRASDVTTEPRRVVVQLWRHDIQWLLDMPKSLGSWLTSWISEAKIDGLPEPLFRGCRGPLTPMGIWKAFDRYRTTAARPQAPAGARRHRPQPARQSETPR